MTEDIERPMDLCVHLYLLFIEANDVESVSYNFPTIPIIDRAHPWTVTLTDRESICYIQTHAHSTNMQKTQKLLSFMYI